MKETIKNYGKQIIAKASAFGALATARATAMVYSDAFDTAKNATEELQKKLIGLAEVLFPLAIVVCAIAMFFTRDQKKFDLEKHIMIGCCLAFALLILVEKGELVTTIRGIIK